MKREKDLTQFRAKAFAILNEAGDVVPCPDLTAWADWMQLASEDGVDGPRRVARSDVEGFYVSTIFLGLNHNPFIGGKPHWFETGVFRLSPDGVSLRRIYSADRYSTRAEAVAGHEDVCAKVRSGEIGE
jgi:hypothetical protein